MTTETKIKSKRRKSGTAKFHMSAEAVSISVPEVGEWTERQCLEFMVKARFSSWDKVSCPHCASVGKHYWRPLEKRWKCASCGSTFSITSGTVFSGRKKSLKHIITCGLLWMNSAGGQPALELKRHMKTSYNSAFAMQHKFREALVRGYNVGVLNGDIEVDGAHQSGKRAAEKRGKPQGSRPIDASTDESKLNEIMLTQTGKDAGRKNSKPGGAIDPEFSRRLPESRRILFTVRKRSEVRGKGACATRVAIGRVESAPIAASVFRSFVAMGESVLNTDTSPAYTELGKSFQAHNTVEHSKMLSGPNGENNNQCEEFNWRFDRLEQGTHTHIGPKYMLDYGVETAFRSDTRRLSNGDQLKMLFTIALTSGESQYWRGFTQGHHRTDELTHPSPQPVPSSGPKKGRHPISSANGRPPR